MANDQPSRVVVTVDVDKDAVAAALAALGTTQSVLTSMIAALLEDEIAMVAAGFACQAGQLGCARVNYGPDGVDYAVFISSGSADVDQDSLAQLHGQPHDAVQLLNAADLLARQ